MTTLFATLEWVDDNETAGQTTEPDIFEIYLVAPDGRSGEAILGRNAQNGGPGDATARFDWRLPPISEQLETKDSAAAIDPLRTRVDEDRSAQGDWKVNVTLRVAGDAHLQDVPVNPPVGDDGNRWKLTLKAERFEFREENVKSLRKDVVSISLQAGQGLEYKVFLRKGDLLEYEWDAHGSSLFYDFHGEKEGDESGAFTSHKSGTASRDAGTLTAPFAGTHGWYWENSQPVPVQIELRLGGVYELL